MRKDSDKIRGMFNDIAPRYDFLNHLLSMGIDKSWRRKCVKMHKKVAPHTVLDLATGTGDMAIAIAKSVKGCIVTGGDLSPEMLRYGCEKIKRRGLESRVSLVECSALNLPFDSESFDALTVAFGVRNYENLELGLSEMLRVVKRGGKIFILEFSKPRTSIVSIPYLFYFKRVLPLIGRMISKSENAYTYLPESVMSFPSGDDFLRVMDSVGYINTKKVELSFGIATLYIGER